MTRYSQDWLPNVFGNFFDDNYMPRVNATAPSFNVAEDDKSYTVEVAAPGMTKDDFNIHLDEMVTWSSTWKRRMKKKRRKARSICVANLPTPNTSKHLYCLTMLTKQRLLLR